MWDLGCQDAHSSDWQCFPSTGVHAKKSWPYIVLPGKARPDTTFSTIFEWYVQNQGPCMLIICRIQFSVRGQKLWFAEMSLETKMPAPEAAWFSRWFCLDVNPDVDRVFFLFYHGIPWLRIKFPFHLYFSFFCRQCLEVPKLLLYSPYQAWKWMGPMVSKLCGLFPVHVGGAKYWMKTWGCMAKLWMPIGNDYWVKYGSNLIPKPPCWIAKGAYWCSHIVENMCC